MKKTPHDFHISITSDNASGEILAVYLRIRKGKSVKTREFSDGAAFADYGAKGELLGIEILQPCSVDVLDEIAVKDDSALTFIKRSVPRGLVATGV